MFSLQISPAAYLRRGPSNYTRSLELQIHLNQTPNRLKGQFTSSPQESWPKSRNKWTNFYKKVLYDLVQVPGEVQYFSFQKRTVDFGSASTTRYRVLNKATVKNNNLLPRIDEVWDLMGGSELSAAIDLRSGYNQIRIAEQTYQKPVSELAMAHSDSWWYLLASPMLPQIFSLLRKTS